MRHPMSWCPDLVTLEVKTPEDSVTMYLSPRPGCHTGYWKYTRERLKFVRASQNKGTASGMDRLRQCSIFICTQDLTWQAPHPWSFPCIHALTPPTTISHGKPGAQWALECPPAALVIPALSVLSSLSTLTPVLRVHTTGGAVSAYSKSSVAVSDHRP